MRVYEFEGEMREVMLWLRKIEGEESLGGVVVPGRWRLTVRPVEIGSDLHEGCRSEMERAWLVRRGQFWGFDEADRVVNEAAEERCAAALGLEYPERER